MNELRRSLRFRLVLAAVVVEVLALSVLVGNSIRINRAALVDQAATWARSTAPLLNASLAAPLAQRDYATVQQVLAEIRSDQALSYLVLTDRSGSVVAGAGWPAGKPLPVHDAAMEPSDRDPRYDTLIPIQLAGQVYGTLHAGLETGFIAEARRKLLLESVLIGVFGVVLSALLLWVIGYFLTR